jgi:hypothetical protein
MRLDGFHPELARSRLQISSLSGLRPELRDWQFRALLSTRPLKDIVSDDRYPPWVVLNDPNPFDAVLWRSRFPKARIVDAALDDCVALLLNAIEARIPGSAAHARSP